jgi:hypothetical protein
MGVATHAVALIRNARPEAGVAGYHHVQQPNITNAYEARVIAVDPDGQQWQLKQFASRAWIESRTAGLQ